MRASEVIVYILMFLFLPITALLVTAYVFIKYPSMCKQSRHDRENKGNDIVKGGDNNA